MAYKAKRQDRVIEDLELCGSDGKVVKTIHVELDADNMVRKLSEKHVALINAAEKRAGNQRCQHSGRESKRYNSFGNGGVRFV